MVNPNSPPTPLPNQRKARDKSPPPPGTFTNHYHHHQLTRPRNTNNIYLTNPSTSSSTLIDTATYHQTYGDSYEFGTANNSFSRTIDLSANSEPLRQANYVYYTVQPGDTLQNLSVKYSCPVASIKRLNNIWSDQEFYGLTKIKLPAGRLKLIAEVIDEATSRNNTETRIVSIEQPQLFTISSPESLNNLSYPRHEDKRPVERHRPSNSSHQEDQVIDTNFEGSSDSFFKNYDLNIERTRSAAQCYDSNAIMKSLAKSGNIVDDFDNDVDDPNDPNKIARREAQNLLNDMSDYGLSYNGLILFIFIVCLICPLAYVIYLEETHHDSNRII